MELRKLSWLFNNQECFKYNPLLSFHSSPAIYLICSYMYDTKYNRWGGCKWGAFKIMGNGDFSLCAYFTSETFKVNHKF